MLLNRIVIAVVCAALICPPASAERGVNQLQLQPSTAWTLNYNPERCSLLREFGSGSSKVHLEIHSFGSWNDFEVLVTGPAIHKVQDVSGTAGVSLSGDPKEQNVPTFLGTTGGSGAVLFSLTFAPYSVRKSLERMTAKEIENLRADFAGPSPDYDATVNSISVRPGHGPAFVLNTGDMAKPLAAMRTCVDDLVKSWGGNPDQQKGLSRMARPLGSTVKRVQADYPEEMLDNGMNGFVPVRLSIDAAGNATSCVIQLENVNQAFARAACANLKGKFEPALDMNGKPVPSLYYTHVIYRIAD